MIITSIVPFDNKRSKVRLDNGTDLCLYKGEIRKLHIEEGLEITDEVFQLICDDILTPRCRSRALHLLEKQDRTESNLRNKLLEGGHIEACIEDAIQYCKDYGYVDDERYARNYIAFHQNNRSRQRLKQDLYGKGVPSSLIDICLDEYFDADELGQIKELLRKRHYDAENATYEERSKQYRFLRGKGYSNDAVNRALSIYDE